MKFSKKEKYLSFAVIILTLSFSLERLLFHPLAAKLDTLNQEIESEELRLKKALTLQGQKEEILKEYEKYKHYLKIEASSREEVVAKLLKQIEMMARKSKVSLVDIKPQPQPKKMGDYRKYNIEIDLGASMDEIVDFFYRLQESGLLLRVEKFSLSSKDEYADILKAKMVITGITVP